MQELEIVREKIQNKYRVVKTDEDLEWNRAIDLCTNIINAHMKHMNDGWIPVEERLPEDDGAVLVSYVDIDDEQYADIAISTYGYAYLGSNKMDFKEWRSPFKRFRINYKVIAWRPLPEPYRPERSDNHDVH